LSREKRLANEALPRQGADVARHKTESGAPLNSEPPDGEQPHGTTSSTNPSAPSTRFVSSDADYELDSEPSDEDTEIPEGSLFDYNVPGVLKAEEVAKLDLDHWKLLVRNMLIDFEVRHIRLSPA